MKGKAFRAVRADDEYHKDVAVKILRAGYDTQCLVERFKSEKRMLAALDPHSSYVEANDFDQLTDRQFGLAQQQKQA